MRYDYDEFDDFYSRPESGAGVILWLFAAIAGFVLALFVYDAYAQAPAVTEPRGVNLVLPKGASVVDGKLNLLPDALDAVVRTQTPEYLQKVAASLLPAPMDFKVGKITGGPGPSTMPVYVSGRVTELAAKVQLRLDKETAWQDATTLTVTRPGYPKGWTWTVPDKYQDGVRHTIYARALRPTGTVIGPLDNATYAAPWAFTIGAAPVIPPPQPPVVTPEPVLPPILTKCGRVDGYDPATKTLRGVVTVDASHVEVRAGGVIYGLQPVTGGKWLVATALPAGSHTATGQALRRSGVDRTGPWEVVCNFDPPFPFTVQANGTP